MTSVTGWGGSGTVRGDVAEMQRARILQAMVELVAQRGYAGTSMGLVIALAKVSRRTFYECFDGLEDCLVVVMDGALAQVSALASRALEGEEYWRDGVRCALAAVLAFFDSEPELARVCIVEALAGGPVVLEQRERVVGAFRALVVARIESEIAHASPLAAEGVLASVMGVLHARLIGRGGQPLIELLGPLMGMIVGLLATEQMVAEEVRRGDELARVIQTERLDGRPALPPSGRSTSSSTGSYLEVPAVLSNPNAHRVRQCLRFLGEHPDASNREVAVGIGVAHQSQISRLLGYLLEENLVVKRSQGTGRRNAWRLTPRGEEILRIFG